MDKTKARLKAKRREQRRKEERTERRMYAEKFRTEAQRRGVKLGKISDKRILEAHKEVEGGMIKESIATLNIAMSYALHTVYGYGNTRLWRIMPKITRIITAVGQRERNCEQLLEEFVEFCKFDPRDTIQWAFDEYIRITNRTVDRSRARGELIYGLLERIKATSVFVLYVMYYDFGWRNKRLERLACAVGEIITDILLNGNGKIYYEFPRRDYYINKLRKECRLEFDIAGRVKNIEPARKAV